MYAFRVINVEAALGKKLLYSQIFRPITTARLQVVTEKWRVQLSDNKLIDFLVSWVGTQKCFPLIYCKFIIAPAVHANFFLLPPKDQP